MSTKHRNRGGVSVRIASGISLWLDDERDPRDSFIQERFGAKGNEMWVKTVEEAINILKNQNVESISFDNDLGEGKLEGYNLAKWIEEEAFNKRINRLNWRIHSANPQGKKHIEMAMISAERFWA